MSLEETTKSETLIPAWPQKKWIFFFLLIWLLLSVIPVIFVIIGKYFFSIIDSSMVSIAASIGDTFGLVNSFFSSSALLFVIWNIRLQRQEISFAQKEWIANTESQNEQARLMRESANLSAINNIYQHYSHSYGTIDESGILSSIAAGHRDWAIRETFTTIDKSFTNYTHKMVKKDYEQLISLLKAPSQDRTYLKQVSMLISSLLVDQRLELENRIQLWPLYEILVKEPGSNHVTTGSFKLFEQLCFDLSTKHSK